jgi:hypothetical protein
MTDQEILAELKELLDGFGELPSLHQAVGALGARLRRCKPGSKTCRETMDRMTELDNKASDIRSGIRDRLFGILIRLHRAEET